MGRIVVLMFLLIPLIEIALFIVVGGAIGVWPTLAAVLVAAILGILVLRVQGLSMINEMRSSMGSRQVPARAMADAMMIGTAGLLLIVPGFFTDLLGLLLLIPPMRGLIYNYLKSKVTVVTTTTGGSGFAQPRVDEGTIELDSDEWRPRD